MKIKKELEKILEEPGMFLVTDERALNYLKNKKQKNIKISKQRQFKPLYIYQKCLENAHELLSESKILFKRKKFTRSFFLALTSYEEIGKSQIAADYHSGLLSDKDYYFSFKKHGHKTSYLNRLVKISKRDNSSVIVCDLKIGNKLTKIRNNSLYVSENNIPNSSVQKEDAEFMIEKTEEWLNLIFTSTQYLNPGRIGTKAIWK